MPDARRRSGWSSASGAMLRYDPSTDRLLLNGAPLGRGTRPGDVEGRIAGAFGPPAGDASYLQFDGREGELYVALGFRDGLLQAGYLSVRVSGDGDWDRLEEIEARRREGHEEVMACVFGGQEHRTSDLVVELVREPVNRSQQIRFYVP